MIQAVIFDNDGVLTHTEQTFYEVNQQTFAALNIPYTRKDFIEHTFETGLGSSGWMKRQGYDQETIDDFVPKRDLLYKKRIVNAETHEPNALPALTILKNTYRLCIATNTRRDMFAITHGKNKMYQLFDEIVCREDYVQTKPAPDAYLAALKKLHLAAEECIVIEDSPRGIVAAQAAGIQVVAIKNPHFPELKTEDANFHIESLTELPGLLSNI